MSGERDLSKLLTGLDVKQHEGVWEFLTGSNTDIPGAIMQFREREGWTHILPAGRSTAPEHRFVWLELAVHSDLNAVGFLAAISNALAEAGVPCNAIAAYYHDHVFVPESQSDAALEALDRLRADHG